MRTVGELIEELQKLPDDALIGVLSPFAFDDGKLLPVDIKKCDCITESRINYCDTEQCFVEGIGYEFDFNYGTGYWLIGDSQDLPQKYVLTDEDGEVIKTHWEE